MIHPVKITHEIIDLSGKLDWATQRSDIPRMEEIIKKLRNEINRLQKFMKTHEADE